MANILITWELGGGSGHVVPYLGLIDRLQGLGHKVAFALQDTTHAANLAARGVACFQAPVQLRPVVRPVSPACTYADILHNCGFDDVANLRGRVEVWRQLFELIRPDLTIFDHSPTALLAARAFPFAKVIAGTGFMTPPDASPLPNLRSWANVDPEVLYGRELAVLRTINEVLRQLNLPSLDRVTQLFTGIVTAFQTFRELDHYPDRRDGAYWGYAPQSTGATPVWPSVSGKRIFAYLKPIPGLAKLIALLKGTEQPTLVHVDGLDSGYKKQLEGGSVVFADGPLDMRAVAAQCDYGVHHGNHGTGIDLLLRGRPMLQLPITLEQSLFAKRVEQLDAGITIHRPSVSAVRKGLESLLSDGPFYAVGAKKFAERYRDWQSETQAAPLADTLSQCLNGGMLNTPRLPGSPC